MLYQARVFVKKNRELKNERGQKGSESEREAEWNGKIALQSMNAHKNITSIKIIVITIIKHTGKHSIIQTAGWKRWGKKDKNYYFHVVFFCFPLSSYLSLSLPSSFFLFLSLSLSRSLIYYFSDYYCCCLTVLCCHYEIHRLILIFPCTFTALKRLSFLFLYIVWLCTVYLYLNLS